MKKRILVCLLSLLLISFVACTPAVDVPKDPSTEDAVLPDSQICTYTLRRAKDALDIVMFRVGRADAMLIATQNHTVLFNTGERDDPDADKIIAYCKAQGITYLDAVIVADITTDNIGGFEKISETFTVGEVIEPFYNATGHRYTKFLRSVVASGATHTSLSEVETRTYDGVTLTLYPAENPVKYETEGDMSLLLTLRHGDNDFLFCTSFTEARIPEILETVPGTFDVVKLPNHGDALPGLDTLLLRYMPTYALISDSAQHSASYEVLSMLADRNIIYHRTHDANVCIRSDGKTLTFTQN